MCFTPYLPDLRASHPEQFRVNRAWPTFPRYTPHIRFLFVRLGLCYRLPPSKSLPFSTCRVASPSPVRADSGLSPHRHTCTAGRTKQTARTLLHVRAVLEIDCSGWVTKSLHGSHPFSVAVRTHASHQQWHASLHPGSCRSCVRRRPRSTWCRSG